MNRLPDQVGLVFVLWGDKYSSDDVRRLRNAWDRFGDPSVPAYCLTDDVESVKHIPNVSPILSPQNWHGWWQKILLFQRGLFPVRYLIFIDLDVVILRDLSSLYPLVGRYDWVHAADPIDIMSSSFMIIDTHSQLAREIRDNFIPEKWVKPEDIDQDYLRLFVDKGFRVKALTPAEHYSYKCLVNHEAWKSRTTNPSYVEANWEEIVMLNFHGYPKPRDISRSPEHWPFAAQILKHWS